MNTSLPATERPVGTEIVAGRHSSLSPLQRWISLAEFLVGGAIVIGHNVYGVVPNEVPILFVLALISFRIRERGWGAMGLSWPASLRRTVLIALAAAFGVIAVYFGWSS